jgi:hypothetical protein
VAVSSKILRSLCSLRMTAALFVMPSAARDLSAQLPGQSFTVVPDTGAVTVGDSVTVRFRIRLHERDQPLYSIPEVTGELLPGVRVLSIQKLTRSAERVYEGGARLAFYRTGRRPVPIFGLSFMRVVEGVSRATLPSDSAFVDVAPVLPAGNPPLKDIKEIDRRTVSAWPALALALFTAALLYQLLRRRRAVRKVATQPEAPAAPPAPSPYEIALQELDRVEENRWPARGNVALHYEAVAQALRRYLEDGYGVGAMERTTSELLWALPPHLGRGGLRDRCHEILAEADLVKFAEVRPSDAGAADFLGRARGMLTAWHEASAVEEGVDALR